MDCIQLAQNRVQWRAVMNALKHCHIKCQGNLARKHALFRHVYELWAHGDFIVTKQRNIACRTGSCTAVRSVSRVGWCRLSKTCIGEVWIFAFLPSVLTETILLYFKRYNVTSAVETASLNDWESSICTSKTEQVCIPVLPVEPFSVPSEEWRVATFRHYTTFLFQILIHFPVTFLFMELG
jgi:hypothetical protein